MIRAGIVGASGYGGSELLRLISVHPQISAQVVAAHAQAGQPVDGLFPNLAGQLPGSGVFDDIDVERLAALDLVFLATPHGPAIDLAGSLVEQGVRVIDLSAAFRLPAAAFAQWYGQEHPRPQLIDHAVYGLTEFARDDIADAQLVANPGCYVITTLLGVVPLASLIEPGSLVVDGKSGTSGAGRAAKDSLHFSHVEAAVTAYGAPGHRHTGEIERYLEVFGQPLGAVSFTPHLVPMTRGLLITAYGQLRAGVDRGDVQAALHEAYDHEPFVHVLAEGTFPTTKAVAGSNGCLVSAVVDDRTGRVLVTSVTDNLGKGAASGALQNANVMFGWEETTGLSTVGVYP